MTANHKCMITHESLHKKPQCRHFRVKHTNSFGHPKKNTIKNIKNERLILHNIFHIIFGYVTYIIIKNVMPLFFIRLPKPLGCHWVFYQTTINICNTFSGFQWLRNYRCQEEDTNSRLLICLRPISFIFLIL